jgi:hypothetical protein
MELQEPDLTASASLQVQQQFYHVSKRATSSAIFFINSTDTDLSELLLTRGRKPARRYAS